LLRLAFRRIAWGPTAVEPGPVTTVSMIFLLAVFWTIRLSPMAAADMALPCNVRATPSSS